MALKIICLAAVGGTVWLFMRPRLPILPHPSGWGAEFPGKPGKLSPRQSRHRQHKVEEDLTESPEGDSCESLAKPDSVPSLQFLQQEEEGCLPSSSSSRLVHVTENARLVHVLLLQGDKPIQPNMNTPFAGIAGWQAEKAQGDVRNIMERAFWDVLREALEAQPWQWQRLAVLIHEARGQLESLISTRSEKGRALLAEMQDKLAPDYIDSRLAAGCDVQYLRQLFDYMVYIIARLEAPARRPQTQEAFQELVQAFASLPESQPRTPADVHLSMRVRRSIEVPVTMQVRDSWLPVELPSPGRSSVPATPPSVSRIASPGIPDDWVLNMGSMSGADFLTSPATPTLSSRLQVDKWEQLQPHESPSSEPRVGVPIEDMVDVQFGPIKPADEVEVTLTTSAAAPNVATSQGLGAVVVQAVRFIVHKARELRSDAALAHLDMLRGLLQDTLSGIDYERQRFVTAIGENRVSDALPRSRQWLETSTRQVEQLGSADLPSAVIHGLLELIQRRSVLSLEDCPETLLLDVPNLVTMQNELQRCCLVAAALLIAQQLLAYLHLPPSPSHPDNARFFAAVRLQFLGLLNGADVSLPMLVAAMKKMLDERCSAEGPQQATLEAQLVSGMLGRIFSYEDPVYQRVERGIVASASICMSERLGAESSSSCSRKLREIGAESILPEVQALADRLGAMAELNLAVCTPLYSNILQENQLRDDCNTSA